MRCPECAEVSREQYMKIISAHGVQASEPYGLSRRDGDDRREIVAWCNKAHCSWHYWVHPDLLSAQQRVQP